MSKPSRLRAATWAAASLAALALAACSDDDEPTTAETFEIDSPASVQTTTPVTPFPPVATIAPVTVDTTDIPLPPSGTADLPIVPGTVDAPLLIEVVVGEDTGEDRIEAVTLGAVVSITIVNPDDADEYHLHGYDLGDGQEFAAGATATFTFAADLAGDFELESHATDDVLLILQVR